MIKLNDTEYTISQFINFIAKETTTEIFCSNLDNLYFMKYYDYRRKKTLKRRFKSTDKLNVFQEFCDLIRVRLKKHDKAQDKLEFLEFRLWDEVLKVESLNIQKIELFKLITSEFNILNYDTLNMYDNSQPFNESIFYSEFGAKLFDYLIREIDSQNKISEANFIFRVMREKDDLIKPIKHDEFDNYLNMKYGFSIGKIKTLANIESDKRHKNYNITKKLLKSNLSQKAIEKNTFY